MEKKKKPFKNTEFEHYTLKVLFIFMEIWSMETDFSSGKAEDEITHKANGKTLELRTVLSQENKIMRKFYEKTHKMKEYKH